jgi:hypothetical protein
MRIRDLLQGHKDAIVERWLGEVLDTYPDKGAEAFRREQDPFANPVGHAMRVGTRGIVESLLSGTLDEDAVRHHLNEMIKVRAVQQFAPSEAVGVVFRLKAAIRAELVELPQDPESSTELIELEQDIDRMALLAFDLFVQHREQVYQLRVNEMKRRVSWVVERLNQRAGSGEGFQ